MRYLLLLLLPLFTLQANAQKPSIQLGIQFSRDKISGDGFINAEPDNFFNRIYRNQSSTSLGITAQFLTNSNISFESGLFYAEKDFSTIYSCPNCFYLQQLSSLFIIAPEPNVVKNRYISIPFLVRYDLKAKKLSPIFEAGINNSFLVENGDFEQTKSAYLESVLGLGISYKINSALGTEIKYNYRRALTSVFSTTDVQHSNNQDPNRQTTQSLQLAVNFTIRN